MKSLRQALHSVIVLLTHSFAEHSGSGTGTMGTI